MTAVAVPGAAPSPRVERFCYLALAIGAVLLLASLVLTILQQAPQATAAAIERTTSRDGQVPGGDGILAEQ